MALPLLPAIAGIAGGALASNALTKKGSSVSTTTTTNKTITDSRSYSIVYPTYQVQIDSPMALQTTKKEAKSEASAVPTIETGTGLDFTPLIPVAVIIGGALVLKEVIR
jgi:hypothetical protein